MSAPLKPWEKAGVNNQNANSILSGKMSSLPLPDTMLPDSSQRVAPAAPSQPPPVPTRPSQQRSLQRYPGMGGGLGGGYGAYGGYSPYGGGMYGGGMYGYNNYGGYGMNTFSNFDSNYGADSFARQAEESSRQAFQSIESIVHAVGSVAMMLESSFYAVYNSFRAVIGVADHFSRMKMAFAQIFSALAVIRTIRWLYHKLLVLLRLRQDSLPDEAWTRAAEEAAGPVLESDIKGSGRSSWPIMLFFAIIVGGPWLIWRVLSSITAKREGQEWYNGKDDHFRAVAEYDFEAEGEEELSFRRGQQITIAPKELQPKIRGWLLACIDGRKKGLIPANYVKILGKRRGTRHFPQTPNSSVAGQGGIVQQTSLLPAAGSEMNQAWSGQNSQNPNTTVSISNMESTFADVENGFSAVNSSEDLTSHGSNTADQNSTGITSENNPNDNNQISELTGSKSQSDLNTV